MNLHEKADYCLKFDFDKSSNNPMQVFRSVSNIVEAFSCIDKMLVSSIDEKIEPLVMLEDVESGSIRVWLRNVLSSVDDEALKDLDWKKQVGSYLVKAKYALINFISDKTELTDRSQIESIQQQLVSLASETDVRRLPFYSQIPMADLISSLSGLATAMSDVPQNEKIEYQTLDGSIGFNLAFNFSPESIQKMVTSETIISTSTMIVKVKKPDYLGDSRWDFRHDKRNFSAKIEDEDFVRKFQARKTDIRPGDSLKVEMRQEISYGHNGDVVASTNIVVKVIDVLRPENYDQGSLFEQVHE